METETPRWLSDNDKFDRAQALAPQASRVPLAQILSPARPIVKGEFIESLRPKTEEAAIRTSQ